ncbi:MAG: sulfur carrier protein ThiS [Solirubrobacteraceae bacterium]
MINGEQCDIAPDASVEQLLTSLQAGAGAARAGRGIAVAVDGEVIPRSSWGSTVVRAGAVVELLGAAQGG